MSSNNTVNGTPPITMEQIHDALATVWDGYTSRTLHDEIVFDSINEAAERRAQVLQDEYRDQLQRALIGQSGMLGVPPWLAPKVAEPRKQRASKAYGKLMDYAKRSDLKIDHKEAVMGILDDLDRIRSGASFYQAVGGWSVGDQVAIDPEVFARLLMRNPQLTATSQVGMIGAEKGEDENGDYEYVFVGLDGFTFTSIASAFMPAETWIENREKGKHCKHCHGTGIAVVDWADATDAKLCVCMTTTPRYGEETESEFARRRRLAKARKAASDG